MTTAAVISFYLDDASLYVSSAGHPPLLLRRREEKAWQPITVKPHTEPANLPLGVMKDIPYDQEQILLASGDRLFLYTDGLIEAPDTSDHPFGEERLQAVLTQVGEENLPQLKQAVLTAVCHHTGGFLAHDDITLIAIEIN
jgi:phosphoserine phosphatase RsbU/P